MGYYTMYNLSTDEDEAYAKEKYGDELGEFTGYGAALFEDQIKWYEHEQDMRSFSKRYPDVLFQLDGKGENNDDVWTMWARNGKTYKDYVKIIYPEFNEDRLQ